MIGNWPDSRPSGRGKADGHREPGLSVQLLGVRWRAIGGGTPFCQVQAGRCSALGLTPQSPPVRAGLLYQKGACPAEDTALTRALGPMFWTSQQGQITARPNPERSQEVLLTRVRPVTLASLPRPNWPLMRPDEAASSVSRESSAGGEGGELRPLFLPRWAPGRPLPKEAAEVEEPAYAFSLHTLETPHTVNVNLYSNKIRYHTKCGQESSWVRLGTQRPLETRVRDQGV